MKNLLLTLIFSFFLLNSQSQSMVLKLWDGNPPTDNGLVGGDIVMDGGRVSNVSDPDITAYLPSKKDNKNIAVIICPGGGYTRLAMEHEGHQFAKWLQSIGISGIVLKYRLPNKHENVPLEDFQQAIRIVRSKGAEWGIDTAKVGVAGFSAGGHLASTASTHFESLATRPDFSILFYPVITMAISTHGGSRLNLLGETPSMSSIYNFSNEKQVEVDTPPAILLLSDDDASVPSLNSIMYYEALKQNNIAASLYIFPEGGHGWGMHEDFKYHKEMLSLLKSWLELIK